MNPRAEHDLTLMLTEYGEYWLHAPVLQERPELIHHLDQLEAASDDQFDKTSFTESERLAYALGYMACAQQVHQQNEAYAIHDEELVGDACELTGLSAGAVCRRAVAP